MGVTERTLNLIKERRQNLLDGNINSISSPFKRFSNDFLGIEQGKYYIVTASTKGGKTQLSSYLFFFYPLLYAYNHPDKVKLKIFYYPLEETPETVIERFMSYLLYTLSNKTIRISPQNLRSTNENEPLPDEIIKLLESEQYKNILNYFLECVHFYTDTNPTGIYNSCKGFIQSRGETIYKNIPIKDNFTGEIKIVNGFDYFKPHKENEYNLIYIDHISLISTEKQMDLRESINKLSEYLVLLRNRYGFTPIVIQQQAFNETIDAFKIGKLKPTVTGLSDSKYVARDANLVLSLFTPYNYELREYMGYDITKFRKNITFLEVLVNRNGESNNVAPLYVDGAVTYFNELPLPTDKASIQQIYNFMDKTIKTSKSFFIWIKNKLN